jgi:predicted kinase
MQAIAQGNVDSAIAAGLAEAEVFAWRDAASAGLRARNEWSDARAAAGFVRRCHGDLHLANLCLWQGRPVLFDALEFDEALATVDVAYDLAFLLMDLEHRQDRLAANRVLNRYVARTGDAGLVGGLAVYLSMRAMIRAHVEARSGHAGRAAGYMTAAADYLKSGAPLVIAIGGLPGSGKSTLARALAPLVGAAPGALVLRSDEIRKRQHGVAPEQRLPRTAYIAPKSVAVFDELARLVATAAKAGHAVIADATFMDQAHRSLVEAAAREAGVAFLGIWLSAPQPILEQRVAARVGDASDATVAVLRSAARADPGAGTWHAVDASDQSSAVNEVLTLVNCLTPSHIAF